MISDKIKLTARLKYVILHSSTEVFCPHSIWLVPLIRHLLCPFVIVLRKFNRLNDVIKRLDYFEHFE